MPNISPSTARPPGAPGTQSRSRMLVVRRPVKTVKVHEPRDPTPVRLAIGVIVFLGALALVTMMGLLGDRLGFAPIVRVPGLIYGPGAPGHGLATGVLMLIAVPRVIFTAGLAQPLWLMIGFAFVALPAAGLGAARPHTPGGPRMKQEVEALAIAAAALGMISGALLIWWTSCPARAALIRLLPADPAEAIAWHRDLQVAAGLDVLAVVVAALWVVLVMRLPVATWLKSLSASACLFALVVATVAMSISNAAAAQVGAARAVCMTEAGAEPRLVLGSTPHQVATLHVRGGSAEVEMHAADLTMRVVAERSIVEFLAER